MFSRSSGIRHPDLFVTSEGNILQVTISLRFAKEFLHFWLIFKVTNYRKRQVTTVKLDVFSMPDARYYPVFIHLSKLFGIIH